MEKFLRLKQKWHGELAGRENEVHLKLGNRLIVVKFLPSNYSIAGHRHLKLGRCQIDLLPFSILTDNKKTIYCMMRLDLEKPIIYCVNGTKLPPVGVAESFLSIQPQFDRLRHFIAFLTKVCQQSNQQLTASQAGLIDAIDCELDPTQLEQLYEQRKS